MTPFMNAFNSNAKNNNINKETNSSKILKVKRKIVCCITLSNFLKTTKMRNKRHTYQCEIGAINRLSLSFNKMIENDE